MWYSRDVWTVLLLLWPTVVAAPAGAADADARLAAVHAALEELRIEDAAAAAELLVRDPALPEPARARAWLLLGTARASLLDEEGATAAFNAALASDPTLTLPADTSPKVMRLFQRARAALFKGDPAPRRRPQPPPLPVARTEEAPPPARAAAEPSESRDPDPQQPGVATAPVLAGVFAGGGLLAGAGALGMEVALQNPAPDRTRAEHDGLRTGGLFLLGAAALFGVGALVAGGVALWGAAGEAS